MLDLGGCTSHPAPPFSPCARLPCAELLPSSMPFTKLLLLGSSHLGPNPPTTSQSSLSFLKLRVSDISSQQQEGWTWFLTQEAHRLMAVCPCHLCRHTDTVKALNPAQGRRQGSRGTTSPSSPREAVLTAAGVCSGE